VSDCARPRFAPGTIGPERYFLEQKKSPGSEICTTRPHMELYLR
jgi:hypothetical protein